MLDSFLVENFRLFRCLEIGRIGRVNLLVGKNNSGKSALLEAIEVYASNASPQTLRSLVADREEIWNERSQPELQKNSDNPLRHLFRNHSLPVLGERGIVLGPSKDPSKQLQLRVVAYRSFTEEEGVIRRRMLTPNENVDFEDEIELALISQSGDRIRRIMWLGQDSTFYEASTRTLPEMEVNYPFQVVPTRNMNPKKVAGLWDLIGLTPLADEVIEGLKLIEPSIIGILFVESTTGRREARMPLVSCSNASEPLPLKSMGDGMTRLFHIIVALVSAKDGILLVDEFENGLHWSVQPAVWKTVFRLAARLNVQVFATTHSRDCVAGFEGAWKEDPESGAFFRLQLYNNGNPGIKAYSLETLADSLDTDVEVR